MATLLRWLSRTLTSSFARTVAFFLQAFYRNVFKAIFPSAVQAVAAIKAKIYEESTTVYPKIVGFESPKRDPALIGAITECLYASAEYIVPVVSKNPQDETKDIFWIKWFSPPPEEDHEEEGQCLEVKGTQDN